MNDLLKVLNPLPAKLTFGTLLSLFSPFKVELVILCTIIAIDTITGSAYAFKLKKFSSSGLRRGFKKLFFYSLCILVVRLLEIGISSLITTTMLTNLVTGFLILTESISSLENLTLLGAPLPPKLSTLILKQIKGTPLNELVLPGVERKEYFDEINDMIDFNLPNIKDENFKKLLEIKFNEWAQLVNYIDIQFDSLYSLNDEILFFRVSSLINITRSKINDRWMREDIPNDYILAFNDWHGPRVVRWLESIKQICTSNSDAEKKKTQIIEKLLILLYQTLTDIKKAETFKEQLEQHP